MFIIDSSVTGKVNWLDDVYIILFDRDGTDVKGTCEFITRYGDARRVAVLPEECFSMTDGEGNVIKPLALLVVGDMFSRTHLRLNGMTMFDTGNAVPGIEGSRQIKIYCCDK